jgi:hypothetical protein
MMPAMTCVGATADHSINFAVSGTHQGWFLEHLAVYVRSWMGEEGRCNMDTHFAAAVSKDLCQYGKEFEKDRLF